MHPISIPLDCNISRSLCSGLTPARGSPDLALSPESSPFLLLCHR